MACGRLEGLSKVQSLVILDPSYIYRSSCSKASLTCHQGSRDDDEGPLKKYFLRQLRIQSAVLTLTNQNPTRPATKYQEMCQWTSLQFWPNLAILKGRRGYYYCRLTCATFNKFSSDLVVALGAGATQLAE